MTSCRWSKHETSLRFISKKGRPTPTCTSLLSSQDLKTVYCLYIQYFHLAECTWRRADASSSEIVTIHVLVRTFTVHVRHQVRFRMQKYQMIDWLIVLGFNDTSTLEGHFVSSPREREKRDRRESRGDEREGQGRKRYRNESEETEEIKTFPLYPYPLQG